MASGYSLPRDLKEQSDGLLVNKSVAFLEKAVEMRNIRINELQDEVAKKQKLMNEMTLGRDNLPDSLRKKDEQLKEMRNTFTEKDYQLDELNKFIAQANYSAKKNEELLGLNTSVDENCQKNEDMITKITEFQLKMKNKDDLIQELNINLAHREQQIEELTLEITNMQDSLKEKNEMIQELNRVLSDKEQHLGIQSLEVAELRRNLTEINENIQQLSDIAARKDQHLNVMPVELSGLQENMKELSRVLNVTLDQSKKQTEDKIQEVQRLDECISERNAQIKTLTEENLKLTENISRLERELLVNKQLQNSMKLRQLEKLEHKSVEIERIVLKIKQETASIAEHLSDRDNHSQPVEQTAAVLSSATITSLPGISSLMNT